MFTVILGKRSRRFSRPTEGDAIRLDVSELDGVDPPDGCEGG